MYNWDVNHRLRSMVNELTGVKVTYGYDEFSNLVWSNQGGQFDFLHRSVDDVGNLYETKEKTDRVYGAGSRLLETKEATFSYDEEGNLAQKVEKNGDTWKYEYNGNGMMSKVVCYSQNQSVLKEVTFKYDSLGRRIEKRSDEKTTRFVWDGNTILHEYSLQNNSGKLENLVESSSQSKFEIPDNLVTWVFNDGFIPSAKITNEGNFSIITDYLGTPVEAYNEVGDKVWSAELDIYGRVKEFTGEKDFIPFRFQGQFEDIETGLYYNRFRYYSPQMGIYMQIDPIGLAGGMALYSYVKDTNSWIDVLGLHGNSLTNTANSAIYQIDINGKTFKYGNENQNRVTKNPIKVVSPNGTTHVIPKGTSTRLASQLRKAYSNFDDVKFSQEHFKNITTAEMRRLETDKITAYLDKHGKVPAGNLGHKYLGPVDDYLNGVNDLKKLKMKNNTPCSKI